jgi:uncharacterized phage infection (PIP) family protein YhgE
MDWVDWLQVDGLGGWSWVGGWARWMELQEPAIHVSQLLQCCRQQLKREVDGKDTQLRVVLEEKEVIEREKEVVEKEREQLVMEAQKKNTAMLAKIKEVEEDKDALKSRNQEVEEACGGFKEVAEKTMEDYYNLVEQLQAKVRELGEVKAKRDKYLNELSKRTAEVKEQEKALKAKVEELGGKDEEVKSKNSELEVLKKDHKDSMSAMLEQVRGPHAS